MFALFNNSLNTAYQAQKTDIGFTDPATSFCHYLISFHDLVMGYIVVVLCAVFWVLFALLVNYSWTVDRNRFVGRMLQFNLVNKIYGPLTPGFYNINNRQSFMTFNYASASDMRNMLEAYVYTHSRLYEYAWATFPTIIVMMILIPSFVLLYSLAEIIDPWDTAKIMGHQWFWSYEQNIMSNTSDPFTSLRSITDTQKSLLAWVADPYSNPKGIINHNTPFPERAAYAFDSLMISDSELNIGSKRLLTVDNPLFMPVNMPIRYLVSSSDVLHSWAVPAMAIKIDAVPGRLSQSVLILRRLGVLYGQCSELCGVAHGFMPIMLVVYPFQLDLNSTDSSEISEWRSNISLPFQASKENN